MIDVTPFAESLEGKPVAVFGLARSGLSTIKALKNAGVHVYAWDDREEARDQAEELGAEVVPLAEDVLSQCACLVLAPGVPLYFPEPHDVVKAARQADIEVICDVEILYRCRAGRRMVGITGTNGKSTTTAILNHVLESCGLSILCGGNIGVPVLDLDMPGEDCVFVLELSSYQLDLCPTLALDIAVLLNITPDHLDRHGSMEGYIKAKERIFDGATVKIVGVDDEISAEICKRLGAVSISMKDDYGHISNVNLRGEHNKQNMAAAMVVARELLCDVSDVVSAFESYPGLPHRQFLVRQIGNVSYVNDSKATNAEAASKALGSYDNIYWIAGGQAKDGGLEGLDYFVPRIRHAFLIGEAAKEFSVWLEERGVPCTLCGVLETATQTAHNTAQGAGKGSVLLSPACASFDQFPSFEVRGETFAKLVEGLSE